MNSTDSFHKEDNWEVWNQGSDKPKTLLLVPLASFLCVWALGIDKMNFQLVKLSLSICWEDIPGPSGDSLGMRERFSSISSAVHHPHMPRFTLAANMFPLGVASLSKYSWVWRSWLKANRMWIRKGEENQIIIRKSLGIFVEISPLFLFKVFFF